MKQILTQLKNCKHVLVASHTYPDGDAIGSLLAMGLALDNLGKAVTIYNASPIPAVYKFLPSIGRITSRMDVQAVYDTAIMLDCGDMERLGESFAAVAKKIPVLVNIDHHVTNTGFGDLQLIDTQACASAEIVYRLIKGLHIPISTAMAAAIYTGIFTDTGSFRFSNTNRAAFAICEEMLQLGVDPWTVSRHVYGTYSLGRIKLLNLALDTIELARNGRVSMMTLTQEMLRKTGTQPEDTDGLINYARGIEDVKLAVLIQQKQNGRETPSGPAPYHVSLRSDGSIDVADLAATFGGGGHATAAGFDVTQTTLPELKAAILRLTRDL